MTVIVRERKAEMELEEAKFEQQMMLVNPTMYAEYIKHKEDNAENKGAIWRVPESIEEEQELNSIFSDIQEQLKNEEDVEADQEFVNQLGLMGLFHGINVEEIGGDE